MLCHGYPDPTTGSVVAGLDLSELGARIASTMGWNVLTFRFRGCGASGGNFSLGGWRNDISAAIDHLLANLDRPAEGAHSERGAGESAGSESMTERGRVWLAGFGTGGGLCVSAAARDPSRIDGVATMGSQAGFDDWASHTRRLLQHSRKVGVIRDDDFPGPGNAWAEELRQVRPVDDAALIGEIPMLVVHGADDESVPVFDARVLADAHGSAELRIIEGSGHGLRYDPRVVAILLGWLDRTRSRLDASRA